MIMISVKKLHDLIDDLEMGYTESSEHYKNEIAENGHNMDCKELDYAYHVIQKEKDIKKFIELLKGKIRNNAVNV